MNIFIEVFAISHPYVGVGEFCLNLAAHLAGHAQELRNRYGVELYFIVPEGKEGVWGDQVNYVSFSGNIPLLSRLNRKNIDLLHLPHQYCRFKHFSGVRHTLMTVHDINFMYEKQGGKLEKYKKRFRRKLKVADYISYISHFTKQDTELNFTVESPSRVIYNGVSKVEASTMSVSDDFKGLLPDDPYLFHISSLRPKKNVHLLIEMMASLPNETLVIAGDWSGRYGQEMKERIRQLGLQNVICLDNVSTEEKIWLFDHCKAFLFPSVCEGFGLPPIEAMFYGKPVFLSTLTSLPEVGGQNAFYWEKLMPQKMAEDVQSGLQTFAAHPEMPDALRANAERFDWEQCTEEYIQYYLEILKLQDPKPSVDVGKRPRVSIVTVCRNDAEGLAKTIVSVMAQSYKNKEYIVVDGASTDHTIEVLHSNAAHFDRWVSEPDGGIYDAMNKAVGMATGEWVIFMNAGDVFVTSDVLDRIFQQPRDTDVIYGDVIKVRRNGTPYVHPAEAVYAGHRMFFCHQSSLVRRQRLLETPFDVNHPYSADFKFFKTMIYEHRTFCQLPYPIAFFNTNGVSNVRRAAGLRDNIRVVCEIDSLPVRLCLLPRLWFQWAMSEIRQKLRTLKQQQR